jgi:hypothetical protein
MPNNISKPLAIGEHAVCITNTSIHSFGELVDCLQLLSLFPFSLTKLSLIIYIRKHLNGLPFRHSALIMPITTGFFWQKSSSLSKPKKSKPGRGPSIQKVLATKVKVVPAPIAIETVVAVE